MVLNAPARDWRSIPNLFEQIHSSKMCLLCVSYFLTRNTRVNRVIRVGLFVPFRDLENCFKNQKPYSVYPRGRGGTPRKIG